MSYNLRPHLPPSPRQRQLWALAARDMGNKEIARALGLSPSTVKQALTALYARLGVRGRAGAALLWAVQATPSERALAVIAVRRACDDDAA